MHVSLGRPVDIPNAGKVTILNNVFEIEFLCFALDASLVRNIFTIRTIVLKKASGLNICYTLHKFVAICRLER